MTKLDVNGECNNMTSDAASSTDTFEKLALNDYWVPPTSLIPYKYDEGKILDAFRAYVDSTYSAHYQSTDKAYELQCFDVWKALGAADTTSRDTAIKYLWRATKKGSREDHRKDIFKVMHYCVLMLHAMEQKKD